MDDHVLRAILAGQALAALLLAGNFFGSIWHDRGWPTRLVTIGLGGVLVYVLAGQVKAFNLGIPFDGFSYLGVVVYAVLLTGMVWHLARERRTRRGR